VRDVGGQLAAGQLQAAGPPLVERDLRALAHHHHRPVGEPQPRARALVGPQRAARRDGFPGGDGPQVAAPRRAHQQPRFSVGGSARDLLDASARAGALRARGGA
jgi:hypothetical protein